MISKQLLSELNTILLEEYGQKLSPQATSDFGYALVGFFECLADINSGNKQEKDKGAYPTS